MTAPTATRGSGLARACLVGLAVSALLVDLGCAHFRSKQKATEKPVATLGSELPGRDIYAKTPATSDLESIRTTAAAPAAAAEPTLAGEIVPAALPTEPEPTITDPGVTLQSPILVDTAKIGAMSTTVGVPDGARLIANSGPRPRSAAPAARPAPAVPDVNLVVAESRLALDRMSTYQLSLRRQERVNDTLLPAEDLIMSIRRAPKAARLTWADGPNQGREVLYRSDDGSGLMHVNMADSKLPLPRLSIAPDSPMVMKNSRHPITEAGLDPLVASMEQAAQAGQLVDLGMQVTPPLHLPQRCVLRRTPAGEVWRAYFDASNHLPSLVECRTETGDLLESYLFQNIQPDPVELASNDAFDPNARWGAPRGLFGRGSTRTADGGPAATTR